MRCGRNPIDLPKNQEVTEFYRTLTEELAENVRELRARLDEALDGRELAEIRTADAEDLLARLANSTPVAGNAQ